MKEGRILHPWEPDEVAFLVRNHEIMSRDELAVVLGRTRLSVINKLQRLGVRSSFRKFWTKAEDEVLRRGVQEGASISSMARQLNVTNGQAVRRIDSLGLYRKMAAEVLTEGCPKVKVVEARPEIVANTSTEGRSRVKVVEVRPKISCKRPVYDVLPLKENPFHMIF